MLVKIDENKVDDLIYSSEYAEFIMTQANQGERVICNGHMLLEAQEDGFMFDEFLKSKGLCY